MMMRYLYPIVVMFLTTACTPPVQKEPSKIVTNTSIKKEEQKICTQEHRPVCAKLPLYCITAPCPSREQTFSNRCIMSSNKDAIFLHEGRCRE